MLDLVYVMSVYIHMIDNGSAWLAEHHCLLRPGGLMLATFAKIAVLVVLPQPLVSDDEPEGMKVAIEEADCDLGGSAVLNAIWWLRRHWGPALRFLASSTTDSPSTPAPVRAGCSCAGTTWR